jgi:hypothetical protein
MTDLPRSDSSAAPDTDLDRPVAHGGGRSAPGVTLTGGADESEVLEEATFYKSYEEHSKVLRTWLVAYGIGAPVLFLTNDRLATIFAASSGAAAIAKLFLTGVVLQVLLAATNKAAMWGCYYAARHPKKALGKRRFRFALWISEQFWIDFLVDFATLLVFGAATWGAFRLSIAAA